MLLIIALSAIFSDESSPNQDPWLVWALFGEAIAVAISTASLVPTFAKGTKN